MAIGSMIKKLRRDNDITQERLAEYLNISAQAISRWECDLSVPDISLLPSLANIFGVTTDTLLGVDITRTKEKVDSIVKEAYEYSSMGHCVKALEIIRCGLKEYPNNYKLMAELIHTLDRSPIEYKMTSEQQKAVQDEIITLGERLLEECTEDAYRHTAIQMLCCTYPKVNRYEDAVKLAKTMPYESLSQEELLASISYGEERIVKKQALLLMHLDSMCLDMQHINGRLEDGSMPYNTDEMIAIYEKTVTLIKTIFDDCDYGFYNTKLSWTYMYLANCYAEKKDVTYTIRSLNNAAENAIAFYTEYESDKKYTSLLANRQKYPIVDHDIIAFISLHLLDEMADNRFDFVRESAEFMAIDEKLKEFAREH